MRVLLDTNVLLDWLLCRAGGPDADAVISRCVERGWTMWLAWHTLSNTDYILHRSGKTRAECDTHLRLVLGFCKVPATDETDGVCALNLIFADFEDALQVAAAVRCQANVIVTNNVGDFTRSPVTAMRPADFLTAFP